MTEMRYAVRLLVKSPGFTLVAVLTLALGIGANTAIFSVLNALVLRPLPYPEPERLVTINHFYPSLNNLEAGASAPGFRDYRDRTRSFEAVAVQTGWQANLTGLGEPEQLLGSRVSVDYFRVYGIQPALGRTFLPEEDEPGNNRVVMLSHGLWHQLFAGDEAVIGRPISLNGEPYEIVGVLPAGFRPAFNRSAMVWTPVALTPEQLAGGRTNEWLTLTARLKPGVSVEAAATEMRQLAELLKQENPESYPPDWSLLLTGLDQKLRGGLRPVLFTLLGAVAFVLLIACTNIANLLLAQGLARRKELGIRAALGAGRRHIVRQLLTESLLLAAAGGAAGLLLAFWSIEAIRGLVPANLLGVDLLRIDGPVLLFTLAASLAAGLLFGLMPAFQGTRADVQDTLREGARGTSAGLLGQRLRRALVVVECALAITLLVGAGLLIKSFARLQGVDPGFRPERVLTFRVGLPQTRYDTAAARVGFFDRALERVAQVPGVRAAGATSLLPFSGGWSTGSFQVEGYEPPPGQPNPWGDLRIASPGFAGALGIPLLRGRFLSEQDREGTPPVVVVDEEMVRRFWPNEDPIGKRISFGAPAGQEPEWITVVGVVGHTKQEGLDGENRVQLYFPYMQAGTWIQSLAFAVRADGDPLALAGPVRQAIRSVDPDQPLADVNTMEALMADSLGERRLAMLLLALFAGLALLLSAVGIYGVMAQLVTQRTRELGVRIALGARAADVLALVVRQGMALAAIGVAVGLLGAVALTRLMASQLFEVRATDPVTFAAVAGLLAATALLAVLVPARRATRVDPVTALRAE